MITTILTVFNLCAAGVLLWQVHELRKAMTPPTPTEQHTDPLADDLARIMSYTGDKHGQ